MCIKILGSYIIVGLHAGIQNTRFNMFSLFVGIGWVLVLNLLWFVMFTFDCFVTWLMWAYLFVSV